MKPLPKNHVTDRTHLAEMQKNDLIKFVSQDEVSVALPSKKLKGNRFLVGPYHEVFNEYEKSACFHGSGKVSKSTLYRSVRKAVKPECKIPKEECKCETDENILYKVQALRKAGIKGLSSNIFEVSNATLCEPTFNMSGTDKKFCHRDCYRRK